MKWVLGCVLFTAMTARGAAFDCTQIRTPTAEDVCKDSELASLNSELNRVYPVALKKATPPTVKEIEQQQTQFLAQLERCFSPRRLCLVKSYERRIAVLKEYGVPFTDRIWRRETPRIAPESEKLALILRIAHERPFRHRLAPDDHPACVQRLEDLRSGTGYSAIEPDFRASSDTDPRLEKWHNCDQAGEVDVKDPKRPYLGFYMLGSPPYRYYSVEIDGDKDNGPEDVLYHEGSLSEGYGVTGYSWVDIDGCSLKGGATLWADAYHDPPPSDHYRVSTLVRYRGDVLALELVPDIRTPGEASDIKYQLRLHFLHVRAGAPFGCDWVEDDDRKSPSPK